MSRQLQELTRVDDSVDEDEEEVEENQIVARNVLTETQEANDRTTHHNRERGATSLNRIQNPRETQQPKIQNANPAQEHNVSLQEFSQEFDEDGFNPLSEERETNV